MRPTYYPPLTTPRGRSAYSYADPEGAPAPGGGRYHAALDWFAPGGSPVRSAVAGIVCEARPSRGVSGQVFGGTVKVRSVEAASKGQVMVFRHVDPEVRPGDVVRRGQVVAKVTRWADGPDHLHLEIWRTLDGGYVLPNMIDPAAVTWTTASPRPSWPPPYGSTLRLVVNGRVFAGWGDAVGPMRAVAAGQIDPDATLAVSWRGHVWRGRQVTQVCASLLRRFVNE